MKKNSPRWLRLTLTYFFRGLLFSAPIFLTVYALFIFFRWADGLIHGVLPDLFPGAGILILIASLTFIGFFTKLLFFRVFVGWLDHLFDATPVTKLIYSSIKDLFGAFVGNKKMFSQPVMVLLFKDAGIQKLGFVTKEDLSQIGIKNMVAVYFPHSYNFSGNLYLVPKENITLLPDFQAADAMKFIVSGGVTELEPEVKK